ncbi:MAG: hypothetical protein ACI841_000172 [Planctomycetota bacterium]|jgi:hypothetical protein
MTPLEAFLALFLALIQGRRPDLIPEAAPG